MTDIADDASNSRVLLAAGGSPALNALPPLGTLDEIAHQMTHGFWGGDSHRFNVTQGGTITVNLTGITEDARTVARAALDVWSDIIGVHFQEVTSGGQITFDDLNIGTGAFSESEWDNGFTTWATVNVSPSRLGTGPGIMRSGMHTYIHEIGHALGLGHTAFANSGTAAASYPEDALWRNDGSAISVMSYFDNGENTHYADQGFTNNLVATPQIADIIAVGNLYGLSTTTRTGDTIYGFNNTSGREAFDAALHPNLAYTIFDSGGADTLDYSGFGSNQVINLNPEAFSNVGSGVGNVVIARGVVIENAIGGAGDDRIIGNGAANELTGNGGSDSLDGGLGADLMIGGSGDDTYYVNNAGDQTIEEFGAGFDSVNSTISLELAANVERLFLGGADIINGTGNGLDNVLVGNSASNILDGGTGADTMRGDDGNDVYIVDNAGDQVLEIGGEGTDTVTSTIDYTLGSNVENLTLSGSASIDGTGNGFNNRLTGNLVGNRLAGLAGDDVIDGAGGADVMRGGLGDDRYHVDSAGDLAIENSGEGADTVYSSVNYRLRENVENLTLTGSAIRAYGNALSNRLVGNSANNILDGFDGADVMRGGSGNDTYCVGNSGDRVIENAGEGVDTVRSSISFALGANVEHLTLTGSAIRGNGNNLANAITGNSGNNVINGGLGADTMRGGAGNDIYYVDNGGDQAIESSGAGTDRIYSTISLSLGSNVEQLFLRGSAALNATGNSLDNTLVGNSAANVLRGAGGADDLRGGGGADVFEFRDGDFGGLTPSTADRIIDFSRAQHDRIDLDLVDANTGFDGRQDFDFIGTGAFTGNAGELRYQQAGGNTYVTGDTNGDGIADFMIRLDGLHALSEGDFVI